MFTPRLFKLKKHTRRVLICKRSLPVFAFLLASLMMVWPMLFAEQKEQFSLAVSPDKKMTDAKVDMEDVRFFSQDKKKQPLTVTAPRVLETDTDNELITLYKPTATYILSSGVMLTSKTSSGLIDKPNETMMLEDTVISTTDTGYKAVSSKVFCKNREGIISSSAPVTITGPTGKLKAAGFKMYNKGDNIDFSGHTDSTLFSKDGDIRIRSENGLLINQVPQTVTAVKKVKVTQQEKTITADKMILTYWTKEQNPNHRVKQIEAIGHVTAESQGSKITGDKGIYDPQKGTVSMTGNVILYQGGSHVAGDKAVLNLNTGESTLSPGKKQTQTRVKGTLVPADMKGIHKQ